MYRGELNLATASFSPSFHQPNVNFPAFSQSQCKHRSIVVGGERGPRGAGGKFQRQTLPDFHLIPARSALSVCGMGMAFRALSLTHSYSNSLLHRMPDRDNFITRVSARRRAEHFHGPSAVRAVGHTQESIPHPSSAERRRAHLQT